MARGLLIFFLLLIPACSSSGPEELDRLVKEDPEFQRMIAARDQVHSQIRLIKDDLLSKKKTMDAQVGKLRHDYDAYSKTQNGKVEKLRSVLDASRNTLQQEIEIASARLAAKEKELDGYQKTMQDVKRVLNESKGISLAVQEKQRWEERVLMLSEKMRPLSEEIQELKAQIRLKKRKIGYLR